MIKIPFDRMMPMVINGRFYNQASPKKNSFMLRSLYMFFVARIKMLLKREPYDAWHAPEPVEHRAESPKITWIGHATFLIQIGGMNILTDPIFGSSSVIFSRLLPPGIPFEKLPPIDAVIISHNHYDHLDESTIMRIKKIHNSTFFVPQGDKEWFTTRGITDVHECMWWDMHTVDPARWVRITFLPAHHWSGRTLFNINKSLWGSWMIEYDNYRIYFAGDTAWGDHFKQINDHFGPIDVVLLPIGPCEPHDWMQSSHINAEQAGEAALLLNARHMIAMHWGTFGFGLDHFTLPIDRINAWWQANLSRIDDRMLHILRAGQSFSELIQKHNN